MEYDNRLRIDHFEKNATSGGYEMKSDYTYFADSRTNSKDDTLDNKFDSTNKYDFAGRLVFNQYPMVTNHENDQVRLYEQNISYDSFSMMTTRSGEHWGEDIGFTNNTYVNGRKQNAPGLTYDASGNIVHWESISPQDYQQTDIDTAGRSVKQFSSSKGRLGNQLNYIRETLTERSFDGVGRPVKVKFSKQDYQLGSTPPGMTVTESYQIWSTVLGSAFTSMQADGTKKGTKVFAGGAVIGSHGKHPGGNETSSWITADPVTGVKKGYSYFSQENYYEEREPLGQEVLDYDPTDDSELSNPPPNETLDYWRDMEWQCKIPDSFYGDNFFSLPYHCQQARHNDAVMFEESNPAHTASGVPGGSHEGGHASVPPDNTPTEKPKDEEGASGRDGSGTSGSIIPESSKPTLKRPTDAETAARRAAAGEHIVGMDEGNLASASSSRGNLDMLSVSGFSAAENSEVV